MSTAPSNLGGGTDAALRPRMPALAPPVPAAKAFDVWLCREVLDLAQSLMERRAKVQYPSGRPLTSFAFASIATGIQALGQAVFEEEGDAICRGMREV